MRRKHKVDVNQAEIVGKLREIPGVSAEVTSALGDGFPDVVAGYQRRNYLFEVKNGNKKQTPDQIVFEYRWRGQYRVIRTFEDALREMGIVIQG